MKIQYRIALIFTILTIGMVVMISITQYYLANQNAFEDFYKRLEIRAIVVAKARYGSGTDDKDTYRQIRQEFLEKLPHEKEYFLPEATMRDSVGIDGTTFSVAFLNEVSANGTARYKDHDIFYYGYLYSDTHTRAVIVISARNDFLAYYLNNLLRILLISIVIAAVLSILIGFWFSGIILRPVRAITQKMQAITGSQLHLRLPVDNGTDEISNLAATFNNMLDRLEATFETQKNFVSNASHELNTPLTTIIGESEYALSKPRDVESYTNSLSVILCEAERLKKITNSLLRLAQTGYNGKSQDLEDLRLDEIIYSVKETVDNIIPENHAYINLSLMPEDQAKLIIKGNQQLLELALVNIVINGCKYSMNAPVPITIAATHAKVIIMIEDQGIGIPADEIAYIYEPFFRASNTLKFNGYGIGLPLSRNIIRMHNGTLDVSSKENEGTTIKITLPLSHTEL